MRFQQNLPSRARALYAGLAAATLLVLSLSTPGFPQGKGGGGGGGTTPPPNPEIAYIDWGTGALSVMNTDGSNARSVLSAGRGNAYYWPSWSPSGASLAFFGIRSGVSGIWTINLDGSNLQLITSSTAYTRLDWSRLPAPDGNQKIVFCDYLPGGSIQNMFLMNADGSNRVNLNLDPSKYVSHVFWMGGRIGHSRSATPNLYTVTLGLDSSGNVVPLTEDIEFTFPSSLQSNTLRSANGSPYLLFREADGLSVLDLSGPQGTIRQLTAPPSGSIDRWGTFSPDDSTVVFDRITNGGYSVYTINLDGSGLKLLRKKAAMPSWKQPAP